jgi:hypothetical protein
MPSLNTIANRFESAIVHPTPYEPPSRQKTRSEKEEGNVACPRTKVATTVTKPATPPALRTSRAMPAPPPAGRTTRARLPATPPAKRTTREPATLPAGRTTREPAVQPAKRTTRTRSAPQLTQISTQVEAISQESKRRAGVAMETTPARKRHREVCSNGTQPSPRNASTPGRNPRTTKWNPSAKVTRPEGTKTGHSDQVTNASHPKEGTKVRTP